jgi:hypothetical protein
VPGTVSADQVAYRRQRVTVLRHKGLPFAKIAEEMNLSIRAVWRHAEKAKEWALAHLTEDVRHKILETDEQLLMMFRSVWDAWERSVANDKADTSLFDRAITTQRERIALWMPTQQTASVTVTATSEGDSAALARLFAGVFSQQKAPELPQPIDVESKVVEPDK